VKKTVAALGLIGFWYREWPGLPTSSRKSGRSTDSSSRSGLGAVRRDGWNVRRRGRRCDLAVLERGRIARIDPTSPS